MGHASLFVVNCFRISIFAVAKTMFLAVFLVRTLL